MMHVDLYRSSYDSSNSASHGRMAVTVVNVDGPFAPTDDRPPYMLVNGPTYGGTPNPVLVPAVEVDGQWRRAEGHYAASGALADASDSRWCRAVREIVGDRVTAQTAVSVHDYRDAGKLVDA